MKAQGPAYKRKKHTTLRGGLIFQRRRLEASEEKAAAFVAVVTNRSTREGFEMSG